MPAESALSTLSRYEALFELSSEINAATEIVRAGELLVRRLKYVADVYSWRYFSLEREEADSITDRMAMVVDGHRGEVNVERIPMEQLCNVELSLWTRKRHFFLEGKELADAKGVLPRQFQKDDIVQIFVCPRFGAGRLQSMLLYSKRRQPFNDLDIKFLTLASQMFHDKVYLLWEQKKLRDLEMVYLQQEIALRQTDKLATLGKLSAGMAHELNNPVAAAQRSAEQLREAIDELNEAQRSLGAAELTSNQTAALAQLVASIDESASRAADLDPISRSDLESDIEQWLEERQVNEPWKLAPTLASVGWDPQKLEKVLTAFHTDQLALILASVKSEYTTSALVGEIREATGRISEIVKALRSYSYLDQAPVQRIDVHEGLNSTLVILRSKLKEGITVRREYDPALPQIEAFGTELNQVWTNIIDNAVSAMKGVGELVLKTYREDPWVVVEIKDTGPGIPNDLQSKIFDPFVTTKSPGEGTGLGLNISHNIIAQKHHGKIDVRSRPGETCFVVKLPLDLSAMDSSRRSDRGSSIEK